ncbi:MAG: ABC transporter ATP-binding protein [Janthinobacterium lividum]
MTGGLALQVEAVSKRFGGLQVFDKLDFAISPGEVLGVIGPNGAGKTTLINVLCGKLPPSSGRVLLGGRSVGGMPLHNLARLGLVRSFQQTNTFKGCTVRETLSRAIRFGGAPSSMWDRLHPLLRQFDLAPRLDEPGDKLPYGLQKMLGLLLTYAVQPKVLLLDEPAAGLERRERSMVDTFVQAAQTDHGCSVLIVEHDMELVRRLCPRILVLDAGRKLAEGPPDTVLARRDVIDAYMGVVDDEGVAAC